jgi:hypothetical protein
VRELNPAVNAQACGGLIGAEVWNESGGSSTAKGCSEIRSIVISAIEEDGSEAVPATKHPSSMAALLDEFESSRSLTAS